MKKLQLLFVAFFTLFITANLFAQPGTIDKNFGKNGFISLPIIEQGWQIPGQKAVITPDGKMLVAFDFADEAKPASFFIKVVRYDVSGKIDNTYGTTNKGEIILEFQNETSLSCIEIQADGKLLLAALNADSASEEVSTKVFRFNINGSLDNTFGSLGNVLLTNAAGVYVWTDMKILANGTIIGTGITGNKTTQTVGGFISRLKANGAKDTTFGSNGDVTLEASSNPVMVNQFVLFLKIAPNNKIIVGGYGIDAVLENRENFIAQFSADGKIDLTFAEKGYKYIVSPAADEYLGLSSIDVQKDNKIVLLFERSSQDVSESELIRLTLTGATDLAFGTQGKANVTYDENDLNFPSDLMVLPNGQIVITTMSVNLSSGLFYDAISRYSDKGIADSKFGKNGFLIIENDSLEANFAHLLLTPDNKIVNVKLGVSANDNNNYYNVVRINNAPNVASKDLQEVVALKASPNPTFDAFQLTYNLEKEQKELKIDLLDLRGMVVTTLIAGEYRQAGKNQEQISLPSSVISGIYLVRIQTAEQVAQLKLVKI